MAHTYLKHYYLKRVFEKTFWIKLFSLKLNLRESILSFTNLLKKVFMRNKAEDSQYRVASLPLPERMAEGFERYKGKTLFILSGQDFVADEFRDLVKSSKKWSHLLKRDSVMLKEIPEATHTFSSSSWRNQVEIWTHEWIESI